MSVEDLIANATATAAPSVDSACCANCAFFTPETGPNNAPVCRRYPPVPFIARAIWDEKNEQVLGTTQLTAFPIVPRLGWCGEFKRVGLN